MEQELIKDFEPVCELLEKITKKYSPNIISAEFGKRISMDKQGTTTGTYHLYLRVFDGGTEVAVVSLCVGEVITLS